MNADAGLFRHCPACGVAASVAGKRFDCAACGFTYYFNPTVAAAAFIVDAEGQVLLIRRMKEPGKGKLAPPGGFVDAGERIEEGLRREIREETGLEVGPIEFLESHPNQYDYREIRYPVIDSFFLARVASFAAAEPRDEVLEIVIAKVGEVDPSDLAFPSMRAAWAGLLRRLAV